MKQINLNFEPMTLVIKEAKRTDLSLAERAALYAAVTSYVRDVEEFLDDHYPDQKGYERDKLISVLGNLGIVLGFNVYADDKPHAGNWTAIEQDWYVFESNMKSASA